MLCFCPLRPKKESSKQESFKKASAALREMQSGCVKTVESLIHRIDFKDVAVKYDIPESPGVYRSGGVFTACRLFATKDGAAGIYVHFFNA